MKQKREKVQAKIKKSQANKEYYPQWWKEHGSRHLLAERQARRAARIENNIRPLQERRKKLWAELEKDTTNVGLPRVVKLTIPLFGKLRRMNFYPVGVLSAMLGRTPQTIRMWERKGYFPETLYKDENGRRLYSRAMIEAACEENDLRGGLLHIGDGFPERVKERWIELGFMEK